MKKPHNKLYFALAALFSITVSAQETFSDTFSALSYSNNNGSRSWASNWLEYNDTNTPDDGRIQIQGSRLRFSGLSSQYITRTANLNFYVTASLSFDWETFSLDGAETMAVQISSDGSSFTTIGTFSGNNSGSFSQDISAYISNNTTVRFIKSGITWDQGNDRFYADNVTISATYLDSDNDGIGDLVDLDDDNDGITDEEEYCTTVSASFLTSADVGERSVVVNHTDTGYLRLDFSSMDNSFQLDINGTTVHPSVLEFENGALDSGDEYFLFQSDGSFINSPWVANSNGLPRLRLIVDESGQVNLYGTRTTSSTSLELMEAQGGTPFNFITWVPGNNNTFTVTNQSGPGPEGFTGDLFASAVCDTDGDGIRNELDLDSDNDGIFDIVESGVLNLGGVSDSNNDGVIDGAISGSGSNGLYNSIEDNDTEYAIPSYSVLDSDADGTYDPYSTDSDGDGCNDVVESGFTDNNDDGYLGPLPITVDSNGLVTSGSDGYTTPADNDSNTTYDYREAGTAPTISSQPANVTTCPGCSTTISVSTTADQFQWQVFNGGSWTDLTDAGIYSGSHTGTLSITNPTPTEDNNQYRVVLTNNSYVCGNTLSNTATLTLQVNTVVTNRKITYRVNKN